MNLDAFWPLLEKYGTGSISYSTLEPDLRQLLIPNVGYASYGSEMGYNFVLGHPICDNSRIEQFTAELLSRLKKPAFVQIGEKFANLLQMRFGYKVTQIGVETILDVQKYRLNNDSKKSRLRASIRKGTQSSKIYELDRWELSSDFGITEEELEQISQAWLSRKTRKRYLKFLIRSVNYEDESQVRKFYSIDRKNRLLGFAFFTPIFDNVSIVGYCCDTVRTDPNAPYGHPAYLILSALQIFRQEGLKTLSLGLSPKIFTKHGFRTDLLTNEALKLLYKYGNGLFNFSGIHHYKKQFAESTVPAFLATKRVFSGLELVALARLMRFI